MKKLYIFSLIISILFFLSQNNLKAQLNGTYTIPGSYNSIAAAINALNSYGVSGNVTFNVATGLREQGSNLTLTASGSSTAFIKFVKSGSGNNPLITATAGIGSYDGIIRLYGVNYITFDGIDLQDSSGNTTNTTEMEWGYALLRQSGTQGCQHDTIRNCNITLNKSNTTGSWGIYSNNINTTGGTITPTNLSGTNSYNSFISVNISSTSFGGFYLNGYADPNSTYYDQNNTITSNGTGRSSITDFGITTSNYNTYGVYAAYQNGLQANNTYVNNNTVGSTSPYYIYGLYLGTGFNSNASVTGDTIILVSSGAAYYSSGIFCTMGSSGSNNTVNINNNVITGCKDTLAISQIFYGIYFYAAAYNLNINGNQIVDNSLGSSGATSTGNFYGIYSYGGSILNQWQINNNNISNNKRFQINLSSGNEYMIYNYSSALTTNISGNICSSDTFPSSGSFYGLYYYNAYTTLMNLNNNTITGIYFPLNSTKYFYGICNAYTPCNGVNNIYNNSVNNITSTGSSYMYPIYNYGGCSSTNNNIYQNMIYNISSNGGYIYGGIYSYYGSNNIYRNRIFGLYSTTSYVYGIYLPSGTTSYIYNNFISDLRATSSLGSYTSPAVSGIYIGGGSYVNLYYNTIFLNTSSSSTTFWTTGVYANTNVNLDMRNNIIENISAPGTSGGSTCAYIRSSNSLSTYSMTSNNNCLFAGAPSINRLLFYDGSNSVQTISAYKQFMLPRDSNSISENPPYVNITTTPYDLHLTTCALTGCESGGQVISSPISITTDFDNQPRFPNSGYPVCDAAVATDIGADEFGGRLYVGIKHVSDFIPDKFALYQNYPNPFNPVTNIKFDIPKEVGNQKSEARLVIFDILGREVGVLINEKLEPGRYEIKWDGTNYSSGVYFYKITAGSFSETKKMMLVK